MRNRSPNVVRTALVVLTGMLAVANPARGQVASETEMRDNRAVIEVRNPSAQAMTVEIGLHHGRVIDGKLELGDAVDAVIGPREFRLQPGASQTVRGLVREPVEPGTVLRVVTTLTPVPEETKEGDPPRGQIVLATRLITRLVAR